MTDLSLGVDASEPREGLVTLAHVIYGLHGFSALSGLVGAATVVGMFLTGWPSVIAVILNYAKRSDVRGTYLDSHFGWQIRTFWYAVLWAALGFLLAVTLIGIPLAIAIFVALSFWILYRIGRGWLALLSREAMPVP
jgi:uncharacterized membrane protein